MVEDDAADQQNPTRSRTKIVLRAAIAPLVVILVVGALCTLGIFGYFNERDMQSTEYRTGDRQHLGRPTASMST
jgi:hypothetical protein